MNKRMKTRVQKVMKMDCNICVCKGCMLSDVVSHVTDMGYESCCNCINCKYGENRTEYCSMRNNYEETRKIESKKENKQWLSI